MSSVRRYLLSLAVLAALMAAACGDPPDKELKQAQDAIAVARAGGADRYAKDEFSAAEESLKRAQDAVAQRDYRLALNNALDAKERAQNAGQEAVNRKGAALSRANRSIAEAATVLTDARARLKTADTPAGGRAAVRAVATARLSMASGETALQEARTAFGQGDYLAAIESSGAATALLLAAIRDLDAAAPPAPRRRH